MGQKTVTRFRKLIVFKKIFAETTMHTANFDVFSHILKEQLYEKKYLVVLTNPQKIAIIKNFKTP